MSGVFLSYKRDMDKGRADKVRANIEALGVDVFQDIDMPSGDAFSTVIEEKIKSASAVLVLWTSASVTSQWVYAEASRGAQRKVLVAATFDRVLQDTLPLPFNSVHTPDISDWIETGEKASHAGWRSVLSALGGLIGRPLVKLAALEDNSGDAKVAFISEYPNDSSAVRLAAELRAMWQNEFDRKMKEAKQLLERRVKDVNQRLDTTKESFRKRLEDSPIGRDADELDPRKIIDNMFDHDDGDQTETAILKERVRRAEKDLANANRIIANRQRELENSRGGRDGNAIPRRADKTQRIKRAATAILIFGVLAGVSWLIGNRYEMFGELSVAKSDAQTYARKLDDAIRMTSALAGDKDGLSGQLRESQQQLESAGAEVSSLGKDKAELTTLVAGLQRQLESAKSEESALRKDKAELSSQVAGLQTQLESAKGAASALGKDKAELSSQVAELQMQLESAKGEASALGIDKAELSNQVAGLQRQLESAKGEASALGKDKAELSSQVAGLQMQLASTKGEASSLVSDKAELSGQVAGLQMQLQSAKGEVLALGKEKTDLSGRMASLQRQLESTRAEKAELQTGVEQGIRAQASLRAERDGLSRQLEIKTANLVKYETRESTRAEAENKCNELAGSEFDADLPAGHVPRRLGDLKDIIRNCLTALTSEPKESWRRIIFQLGRGYMRQGWNSRSKDETAATLALATATSLDELASEAGSGYAAHQVGWIYHGGPNTPRYHFPGTPNYNKAWENFKRAAEEGNSFGLLAAGMYHVWPECFGNVATKDTSKGLEYIKTAVAKNNPDASFTYGYMLYYGVVVPPDKNKGFDLMINYANGPGSDNEYVKNFMRRINIQSPSSCPPDVIM